MMVTLARLLAGGDGSAVGIREGMLALAFSKALLVPPLPFRPTVITSARVWDSRPQTDLTQWLYRCRSGCSWQNQARGLEGRKSHAHMRHAVK